MRRICNSCFILEVFCWHGIPTVSSLRSGAIPRNHLRNRDISARSRTHQHLSLVWQAYPRNRVLVLIEIILIKIFNSLIGYFFIVIFINPYGRLYRFFNYWNDCIFMFVKLFNFEPCEFYIFFSFCKKRI